MFLISISISIASIEIKNVDITPNNPMIGRYSYAIVEVDFSSRDNLDYTQIMFDIPELNLHSVGNFHKKVAFIKTKFSIQFFLVTFQYLYRIYSRGKKSRIKTRLNTRQN